MVRGPKGLVSVFGDKEIDSILAGLPLKIKQKAIRHGLRAVAKKIARDAKANLVGHGITRGTKRDSKKTELAGTGQLYVSIRLVAMRRSRVRAGVAVVTKDAPHANLIEYGTKSGGIPGGKGSRGPTPARPFLRPAGYGNKAYAHAQLVEDVRQTIAKLPTIT